MWRNGRRLSRLMLLPVVFAFVFALVRYEMGRVAQCPECEEANRPLPPVRWPRGIVPCIFRLGTEHERFLRESVREMKLYHDRHGRFAKEWHQLGFSFTGNAIKVFSRSDPALYPRKADRNRWRPVDSTTTYVIAYSSKTGFTIDAMGEDGRWLHRIEYEASGPETSLTPGTAAHLNTVDPSAADLSRVELDYSEATRRVREDINFRLSDALGSLGEPARSSEGRQ